MSEFTPIIRSRTEKAFKEFTLSASVLGFSRTKTTLWTRQRISHAVDFVNLHRQRSINASVTIEVSFGIRVLNDEHPGLALNGPCSDAEKTRMGRYHFRFNAVSGSTYERCIMDLERFLIEVGEPWFRQFADTDSLLEHADSPLGPKAKDLLIEALMGNANSDNLVFSCKELGIKMFG